MLHGLSKPRGPPCHALSHSFDASACLKQKLGAPPTKKITTQHGGFPTVGLSTFPAERPPIELPSLNLPPKKKTNIRSFLRPLLREVGAQDAVLRVQGALALHHLPHSALEVQVPKVLELLSPAESPAELKGKLWCWTEPAAWSFLGLGSSSTLKKQTFKCPSTNYHQLRVA